MGESASEIKNKRRSKKARPANFCFTNLAKEANRVGRTTSLMWDQENDPFQVFEVEHESCWDLKIEVKRGGNITKGFYKDLLDIPDPYVILRAPGSSNSSKRTSHVDNNVNPIWNETFHFFLDPKKEYMLQVTLMDANHFQDDILGTVELDVNLLVQNVPSDFTLDYPGGSKVYVTLTLQKNKTPDLRFSLSLCEEEKNFLRKRRLKVLDQMQKLLGDEAPKNKGEVPIIAVLGSGGGFRAMTCFSAAVKALHRSGILGCSTYISGLSGSSWFISTLYAHDKFPNVTCDEIFEELKTSVTQNWKWNLTHSYRYIIDMMNKSRRGQPVSFTDIFGHLLGDVLLKGKKDKMLSDQRAIVSDGNVPLPLYTCLHAKGQVSARAFSEWIEFSPYEIGIAKYGTFMKTEYFGSKFIVGKLIKQFPEFPLHYLQGVFGSAFTILMKRLAFEGGPKQDLVQMMRDERDVNENLEQEIWNEDELEKLGKHDSDTDDEVDVEGADDKSSDENDKERTLENDLARIDDILGKASIHEKSHEINSLDCSIKEKDEVTVERVNPKIILDEALENTDEQVDNTTALQKEVKKTMRKGFSFDFVHKPSADNQRKLSQDETRRKISSQSDPGTVMFSQKTNMETRQSRLGRKGAIRERAKNPSTYWAERRNQRKSQKEQKPTIFLNWMKSSGVLNSRAGRAGEILNPFRGLSLRNSFPISPFTASLDEDEEGDMANETIGLGSRLLPLDNTAKKLFIVDSGLAFNSPYPLLLRPQRAVDLYLSFDFSQRPSDSHMPFKELMLAEKWAQQNQVLFPPIEKQVQEYSKDREVKELYIFKDPDNPFCPVILHFTIVNNRFKWYKAPGVPRETTEEIDFANFSLFNDPRQPYASTNFVYEPLQYERLFKLVEYNTLINIETIKEEIKKVVELKRKMMMQSAEEVFSRMQKVLQACKKFQRSGNLSLRINEDQRKQFLLACKAADNAVKSASSSVESGGFYDALDDLGDSEDSESECDAVQERMDDGDRLKRSGTTEGTQNIPEDEKEGTDVERPRTDSETIQFPLEVKDCVGKPSSSSGSINKLQHSNTLKLIQNITATI